MLTRCIHICTTWLKERTPMLSKVRLMSHTHERDISVSLSYVCGVESHRCSWRETRMKDTHQCWARCVWWVTHMKETIVSPSLICVASRVIGAVDEWHVWKIHTNVEQGAFDVEHSIHAVIITTLIIATALVYLAYPCVSALMYAGNIYVCLNVYICINIHIYVCLCVCMYVIISTVVIALLLSSTLRVCVYIWVYICLYACMYARMYVCMYICLYVCVYARMYVYMYVCMYICMYVCMCVWMSSSRQSSSRLLLSTLCICSCVCMAVC